METFFATKKHLVQIVYGMMHVGFEQSGRLSFDFTFIEQ